MVSPERVIRLAGSYRGRSIDALLQALEPALAADPGASWFVDLGGLRFLSPSALAVTSVVLEEIAAGSPDVRVRLPDDAGCRRHVQGMELLPPAWRVGESVPSLGDEQTSCRIRRFADERDYPVARRSPVAEIERICGLDDLTCGALTTCLDELCENVVDHAAASVPAVILARAVPALSLLEVAIADLRCGVRASLAGTTACTEIDDAATLDRASALGITSTPGRNAGMGLALAHHLARSNGGTVAIRSGTAAASRGVAETRQTCRRSFPGTLVVLEVRIDRPLDLIGAYDRMDDETRSS